MSQDPNPLMNPLLHKIRLPGETYRLPSQGLFYNDGELSEEVLNGEVVVRAMTVIDEITLKTPDLLFSGKAVDEVFSRCIPQIKKPSRLLAKDVDFLFTALRLVTYGPEARIRFKHDCADAKEHEYTTQLRPLLQKARSIDPTTLDSYKVTLENGQIVRMRPIVYQTIVDLNQASDSFAGKVPEFEEIKRSLLTVMVDTIASVDDTSDRAMIDEWLRQVPAGWVSKMSDATEKLSDWGINFSFDTTCKDCEAAIKVPVGANPITFFI